MLCLSCEHFPQSFEEMTVGHFQHTGNHTAFDAAGKRRANYIDAQIKEVKHFEQLCNWADAAVSETKGLFLPAYLTPGGYGFLKAAPSVVRDEVQQ